MTSRRWIPLEFALGSTCFVVPSTGSVVDLAGTSRNTTLGAACFLACALDTLRSGRVSKMPVRRRPRALEHELEEDVRGLSEA